jgi:hypothetical protein
LSKSEMNDSSQKNKNRTVPIIPHYPIIFLTLSLQKNRMGGSGKFQFNEQKNKDSCPPEIPY